MNSFKIPAAPFRFEPKPLALQGTNYTDRGGVLDSAGAHAHSFDEYNQRVYAPIYMASPMDDVPSVTNYTLPGFSSAPGQGNLLPSLVEGSDISHLESLGLQGLMSLPSSMK